MVKTTWRKFGLRRLSDIENHARNFIEYENICKMNCIALLHGKNPIKICTKAVFIICSVLILPCSGPSEASKVEHSTISENSLIKFSL